MALTREMIKLAWLHFAIVMNQNDGSAADDRAALPSEIKRHDGNFLHVNVKPDIELGPIRERKNANAFALVDAGVKDIPKLWPLVFGVPLPLAVPEGVNTLFGPRFLLVPPGPTERRIKPAVCQGIQQGLGFEQSAAFLRSQSEWISALIERLAVLVDDQFRPDLPGIGVTERYHFGELIAGVDVQQREGNLPWEKGLLC